ncbi:MAG: hypothetical protein IKS31_08240 [Clostridia bacterium]|nr:hypothetical protein [Clostridia bacterium]
MRRSKVLAAAAAILTLLTGASLCAAAVTLYTDGLARRAAAGSATLPIFTRELVGQRLLWVLPVAGVWAAVMIAAALTGRADGAARRSVSRNPEIVLTLLGARLDALPEAAKKEQAFRRRIAVLAGTVIALCAWLAAVWLLDGEHFADRDPEEVMGPLLIHVLPPTALALAGVYLTSCILDSSREREIAVLTAEPRMRGAQKVRVPMEGVRETERLCLVRGLLFGLAAALILLGVLNGGMRDVLIKAINICTECIGLG